MVFRRECGQIRAKLGEDRLRRHHINAVNRGQIHSRNPFQFPRQIQCRCIASRLLRLFRLFGLPLDCSRLQVGLVGNLDHARR